MKHPVSLLALFNLLLILCGCGDMTPLQLDVAPITVQVNTQPIAIEIATLQSEIDALSSQITRIDDKLITVKISVDDNRQAIDNVSTETYTAATDIKLVNESIRALRTEIKATNRRAVTRKYTTSFTPEKSRRSAQLSVSTTENAVTTITKALVTQCSPATSTLSAACSPSSIQNSCGTSTSGYYAPSQTIYAAGCSPASFSYASPYSESCGLSASAYYAPQAGSCATSYSYAPRTAVFRSSRSPSRYNSGYSTSPLFGLFGSRGYQTYSSNSSCNGF